ncbi:hypothetical protein GCM10010411_74860 [Actinomadura fulvescens]|uniref:CobQ/CobB/MinD/ParA nucleotide binding domain-containing protein n=1 Tax=Actinomadura fulvescens TaxID=46160 RepID=A0ABN3QHS3_9ACTN
MVEIVVSSQVDRSGKTTSTINLAASLELRAARPLIIDNDAASSAEVPRQPDLPPTLRLRLARLGIDGEGCDS